jgi:plastocyanin
MNQVKKEITTLLLLAFCSVGTSVLLFECKKNPEATISQTSSPNPGANEVWIQNLTFVPSTISVNVNSTVTWVNKDAFDHTVSSSTGEFESGNMTPGTNYSYQFKTKGSFPYKCSIHSSMTGTVVVK